MRWIDPAGRLQRRNEDKTVRYRFKGQPGHWMDVMMSMTGTRRIHFHRPVPARGGHTRNLMWQHISAPDSRLRGNDGLVVAGTSSVSARIFTIFRARISRVGCWHLQIRWMKISVRSRLATALIPMRGGAGG